VIMTATNESFVDSEIGMGDIELRVPGEARYLPIIRSLAASIALREDFDLDFVADLKLAVDEAWDDAMDFALSHIFGATLQTALFVAPLVVIISWIAGKKLDLNFEIYQVVVLVFAVLIIGNFIKDNKSNYLEGALLVIFYILIAAGTYWYPNPEESAGVAGSPNAAESSEGGETATEAAEAVATEVARMLMAKW